MIKMDEVAVIERFLSRFKENKNMSDEDIDTTIADIMYNVKQLAEYKWMYEELES